MKVLAHFFDSQFFVAIVTLLVGLLAIYIYKKQQKDAKRSAANTVLLEIQSAESILKKAKDSINESRRNKATQIPEHTYLMPTESWSKYKSMFVKDFKKEQWDRISKFYSDCELFDETIAYNDSMFLNDTTEIRKNVHKGLYKYASVYAEKIEAEPDEIKKEVLKDELKSKKQALSEILTNAEYMYTYFPSKPIIDIEKYVDSIEAKLDIDDVGQKLQDLAKSHWLW